MADDKKTNEKKQRLLTLLREMFQLDQPDLDFGLYRIMHAKRGQVEAFLETEFDQLIDKVFADRGARHEEEAKREYEAARQQAIEFGAPDPDAAPKVQQARARYEVVRLTGGEDAEIYDHLHRFFSRYYDQGDFMSLRRYGKGAAGGAETYAVPYDGSEVVLHWANKDQYYIKTTENFAEFSFDPRKALQKDERGISRSLFDDEAAKVGAGASGKKIALKVHFRIVEAAEGAHNNVKASDKDERYFILDAETPLAWDDNELVIRINYRTDPEKTGQKAKWQDKRNEQLVQTVLESLKGLTEGGNALAGEYYEVLAREVSKGKDKKQLLLARYVGQYTASNTMDYFIHKDLGGFLRRELDFYLKNEVLKLDDFVGGEDADVQAGLTDARMKAMKEALEKAQAIRLLSQRLIDFLAQLEEFQKKLWLKKKFVVETHYCITLDRIPEKFYPEIAANDRQREEWVALFAIDEISVEPDGPIYTVPLSVEFLKANPFLVLDTAVFSESFQQRLLAELDDLEAQSNGLLIHSDNFQALRAVRSRYENGVKCIYIDPPYNTASSSIPYKNDYRHSSFATMMNDRVGALHPFLSKDGAMFVSIDKTERTVLQHVMDGIFGSSNSVEELIWSMNTNNSQAPNYSTNHEYVLVYAKDKPTAEQDKNMFREPKPGYEEVMALVARLNPDYPPIAVVEEEICKLYEQHKIDYREEVEAQGLEWEDEKGNDPWKGLFNYCNAEYRDADDNLIMEIEARSRNAKIWVWQEGDASMPATKQAASTRDPEHKNWRFYRPLHPATKRECPHPKSGWKFAYDDDEDSPDKRSFVSLDRDNRIAWGPDEKKVPRLKRMLHEVETNVGKSVFADYSDGEKQTSAMFGRSGVFLAPKHADFVSRFIQHAAKKDSVVLDCFGGTGSTAHAVIKLNRDDNGKRQYVTAEMGRHFDTVLKPRVLKAVYSRDWRLGKPHGRAGISQFIRVVRLESYEDCLNNLALSSNDDLVANAPVELQRDYLLRYMLDVETQGSQSLLNVAQFRDPTAYQLEIKKPGSDEREKRNVDLVETFNWLIGLHVDKLHAGRRFAATFVRKPDPLLPEDANTRLQVETLTEAEDGAWWFRPVEGYVRTKPGDDRHRQSVLVLWRTLTDDPEQDAAALEAFLSQQMKFDPTRREDKTLYDIIYINGTHNLPNLGKYGEVRLLEEEFHRRMWAGEEN
jgi:adenine-specific DNA-methyltransferase